MRVLSKLRNVKHLQAIKTLTLILAVAVAAGLLPLYRTAHAATPPAFVQTNFKTITSGSSVTVSFTKATTAGNLIVAYMDWGNTGAVTLSDNKGDAYVSAFPATRYNSNKESTQTFYAKNIAAGTTSVTATFGTTITSGSYGILYIHEYSGIDKTNPLDVAVAASGTASAMNSGSATTTNASDLIFGGAASSNRVSKAGTGFTTRSTGADNMTEDKVVSTAGSYNATATQTGTAWGMQMVAFKADAGTPVDTTPPSVPTNLAATAVSSSQVNLSWTGSTDNVGVTGYKIYRNGTQLATTALPTYNDTSVSPSTNYTYTVSAFDAAGNNSAQSTSANVTTPAAPDTTPPSVPMNLTATTVSTSQINLAWDASSDNVGVTGYKVYRGGNQIGTTTGTTYQDTGLTQNTQYAYTVAAYDAAGNTSAQSTGASATTQSIPDTTAPSVPMNLNATPVSSSQIKLTWTASSDNVGVIGYKVFRNGAQVDTTTTASYNDTGLDPNTNYTYTVSAYDAAGNESAQSDQASATTQSASDTTPPSVPTNLNASAVSSSQINLSWTGSTDDTGVAGYNIYRNGTKVATSVLPTYNDTGLDPNTTYTYTVSAFDLTGNESAQSTSASATTQAAPDTTAPSVPSGLSATAVSSSQINLSWAASTDNVGVTGYKVYRGGSQVATTASTTYSDTGLNPSTSYTYTVAAYDAAGNTSAQSTSANTMTQQIPDTTAPSVPTNLSAVAVSASQINLSWTASTDNVGVTGYKVYRNGSQVGTSPTASYNDTGLSAGTNYVYTVSAYDAAGNASAQSTSANATTQAAGTGSPAWPLKVSANKRYLVDQNNVPFLITGDSPQAMTTNLPPAQVETYMATRQAQGYNTLWIDAIDESTTGGTVDYSTKYDGVNPFTTPYDLSTPNEVYFQRLDAEIQLAQQHNMLVFLAPLPIEDSNPKAGEPKLLEPNGTTKDFNYGAYLGNRYKNYKNIIWLSGIDLQNWSSSPSDDALAQQVAAGIKSTDPDALQTVELNYLMSASQDDSSWSPYLGIDASYTYYPAYGEVTQEYNKGTMPTYLIESIYDGVTSQGYVSPQTLRKQEWWTVLSGGDGSFYGSPIIYPFASGWQTAMTGQNAVEFTHVEQLMAGKAWYNLVPDHNKTFVTAGGDDFHNYGTPDQSNYITGAVTADGTLGMAYVPGGGTFTINMAKMSGPVTAQWYDPANGTYQDVSGSPFGNTGTRNFTTPGNNGDGQSDWVLVLQATATPDTTAPSVPTGLATSAVTASQVGLTWSASTDNFAVAGYKVYRDGTLLGTANSASYTDNTVAANTTYTYTVSAFDYAGNESAQSAGLQVNTANIVIPPPAFVQVSSATPAGTQATVTATYAKAQTAGNTNVVAIGWNDTTSNITSVTDSAGNTYTIAAPVSRGNGFSQAIYYASNIVSAGANSNKITVTFDHAALYVDIRALEYSGLDQTNPVDVTSSGTGVSSTANSGSVTTHYAKELLFSAGMTYGAYTNSGTGYTTRIITSPDKDIAEDQMVSATGTYSATAPQRESSQWVMQIVAFKAAGQ